MESGRECDRLLFLAVLLMGIVCLLSSAAVTTDAASASADTKATLAADPKFHHYREGYRRNLLANGLGLTPPMGSLSLPLSIFLSVLLLTFA